MSQVTRTQGVAGTFSYTTPQVPFSAPTLTIYSDPARTVVAVAAATLVATANPVVWTASYPATLAVGTYYLSFATVYTSGQPAFVDQDDTLELLTADGWVTSTYASVQDVRRYGVTTNEVADDTVIADALEIASRIVDRYTGRDFAGASVQTKTFHDVRVPVLRMKTPFTAISSVKVDGRAITVYDIEPWGIRLYNSSNQDADGWPKQTTAQLGVSRWPYGSKVEVTATFGYPVVPAAVKKATVMLATAMIRSQLAGSENAEVESKSVEGYSVSYATQDVSEASTGSTEVDLILSAYRPQLVG